MILRGSGVRRSCERDVTVACGSCAKPSAVLQRPVGAFSASTGLAASTRAAPRVTHPASTRREWWCFKPTTLGDEPRDADQDYLEPDSEASGIRLRDRAARGADRRPRADGRHRAAPPQSTAMRRVRTARPGVRPARATPVRVRPALGPARLLPLPDAARGVCPLWHHR